MAINSGVNISKAVSYAVLRIPPSGSGVNISKANASVVLSIPFGVDITKAVAFAVLAGVNPPAWGTTSFPNGVLTSVYSAGIALSAGSTPITFSVVSGSLPAGLSLSGSGIVATVSGTPTVAGAFTFTLRASNPYGTADKSFTITISNPSGGVSYTFW